MRSLCKRYILTVYLVNNKGSESKKKGRYAGIKFAKSRQSVAFAFATLSY